MRYFLSFEYIYSISNALPTHHLNEERVLNKFIISNTKLLELLECDESLLMTHLVTKSYLSFSIYKFYKFINLTIGPPLQMKIVYLISKYIGLIDCLKPFYNRI